MTIHFTKEEFKLFVDEVKAETYLDQKGKFISEEEYEEWGKRQNLDQ